MRELFNELRSVAGFLGVCLYYPQTAAVEEAMPEGYTEARLAAIGGTLVALYQSGSTCFGPLHDTVLYENGSMLLMKKITDEAFVYVLAEAGTNIFLLRIALGLLSENLLEKSGASAKS
ncbi:MAG TPA: hypothetical protein VKO20_07735 [Desulfosalsimonadaceae bacterium]|nr:hypothetical protein [Desulfosalsimonadaceae bacterium]